MGIRRDHGFDPEAEDFPDSQSMCTNMAPDSPIQTD